MYSDDVYTSVEAYLWDVKKEQATQSFMLTLCLQSEQAIAKAKQCFQKRFEQAKKRSLFARQCRSGIDLLIEQMDEVVYRWKAIVATEKKIVNLGR